MGVVIGSTTRLVTASLKCATLSLQDLKHPQPINRQWLAWTYFADCQVRSKRNGLALGGNAVQAALAAEIVENQRK